MFGSGDSVTVMESSNMNAIEKERKTENFKEEDIINSPEFERASKEKERNEFIAFALVILVIVLSGK